MQMRYTTGSGNTEKKIKNNGRCYKACSGTHRSRSFLYPNSVTGPSRKMCKLHIAFVER